ncbi:MAG: TolC family protein [Nitrospinae bacterium]|nr:TolC family protein [Nitrospinota bacterium]
MRFAIATAILALSGVTAMAGELDGLSLRQAVDYALSHNPRLNAQRADIRIDENQVNAAQAEKGPRIDLGAAATRGRYYSPLTPISILPGEPMSFPEFKNPVYDAGASFSLPLYRGGRLERNVNAAMLKKTMSEELYKGGVEDVIFNVTSAYYKIMQLNKLVDAAESNVKRLTGHKRNAELFYKTGTAAKLDLLKTDVQLSSAVQSLLTAENGLKSAHEFLKALLGVDDPGLEISISGETDGNPEYPAGDTAVTLALENRPELAAARARMKIAEERVSMAGAKRLPSLTLSADYAGRAGDALAFNENWNASLKMTLPFYDGGAISAETAKEREELEKAREDERGARINIVREVKEAQYAIENAAKRMEAAKSAVDAASEAQRIETLKYNAGAGISADVLDANAYLLRSESDYLQALFDRDIAVAALRRAIGGSNGKES